MTNRTRARSAARQLRRVFGGLGGLLGRTHSVAWANSPYTGGSYTAYAPGQVTRFRRALRLPQGRIHLAGEHTDAFTGYMEGAVRSGRRVAREINRR